MIRHQLGVMRARIKRRLALRRWKPLVPTGTAVGDVSPGILGLDPGRAHDLGRIVGLSPQEVVGQLCVPGAERLVEALGTTIWVRPGTADVFTIDDTFGAGYHRSPWPLPAQPLIFDLGANIGLTVIDYAQLHPGATIFAVELDVENARLARENTETLPGVTVIHAGVAAEEGELSYGAADTNSFSIMRGGGNRAPGMTITQLLDWVPGRRVDLLKMDIEGAERDVLGTGAAWAQRVQRILVEVHEPYTREQCLADLERLGFRAAIDDRHPAAVKGILEALED